MAKVIITLIVLEFIAHFYTDITKYRRDQFISHSAGWRIMLFILLAIPLPTLVPLVMVLYLISFNILFNVANRKEPEYLGAKAITDRLLRFIRIKPTFTYLILIATSLWISFIKFHWSYLLH